LDGPVGDMLRAQKRHGHRPSHTHFLIGAQGYRELVTALYARGDDHLESDTVFGVTDSLVIDVRKDDPRLSDAGLPKHPLRLRAGSRRKGWYGPRRRGSVANPYGA
jgi:hypothetical protein